MGIYKLIQYIIRPIKLKAIIVSLLLFRSKSEVQTHLIYFCFQVQPSYSRIGLTRTWARPDLIPSPNSIEKDTLFWGRWPMEGVSSYWGERICSLRTSAMVPFFQASCVSQKIFLNWTSSEAFHCSCEISMIAFPRCLVRSLPCLLDYTSLSASREGASLAAVTLRLAFVICGCDWDLRFVDSEFG